MYSFSYAEISSNPFSKYLLILGFTIVRREIEFDAGVLDMRVWVLILLVLRQVQELVII